MSGNRYYIATKVYCKLAALGLGLNSKQTSTLVSVAVYAAVTGPTFLFKKAIRQRDRIQFYRASNDQCTSAGGHQTKEKITMFVDVFMPLHDQLLYNKNQMPVF